MEAPQQILKLGWKGILAFTPCSITTTFSSPFFFFIWTSLLQALQRDLEVIPTAFLAVHPNHICNPEL